MMPLTKTEGQELIQSIDRQIKILNDVGAICCYYGAHWWNDDGICRLCGVGQEGQGRPEFLRLPKEG